MTRNVLVLLSAGVLAMACSDDPVPEPTDSGTDTSVDIDADAPPPNPDCDPLVALDCAMPWPSNLYLEDDPSRVTGVTLSFGPTSPPLNYRGVHLDPEIYRRMDGFGVTTPILTHFPNADVSALAADMNVEPSLGDDALILLFSESGGALTRVPTSSSSTRGKTTRPSRRSESGPR